jgi:hypothetical protein
MSQIIRRGLGGSITDISTKEKVEEYLKKQPHERITPEDISEANKMIDLVLENIIKQ